MFTCVARPSEMFLQKETQGAVYSLLSADGYVTHSFKTATVSASLFPDAENPFRWATSLKQSCTFLHELRTSRNSGVLVFVRFC